jgi:cob(I)alamin adenosyltransferase
LTRITTRTGDDGKTNLGDSNRIPKDAARIVALGTLDELNSALGMVLAQPCQHEALKKALQQVQQDLFDLGGELCPPFRPAISTATVLRLEQWISDWNTTLPPLKEFILPNGNMASATCHLARTICRRAERCLVSLHHAEVLNLDILRYMNRLSDVLFIAARVLARETSEEETVWKHDHS